jgi:hypothetical protein
VKADLIVFSLFEITSTNRQSVNLLRDLKCTTNNYHIQNVNLFWGDCQTYQEP